MTARPRCPSRRRPTTSRRGGPPRAFPQQFHLDITVDDIDDAEPKALALGARPLPMTEEKVSFRVYADPAGHPFCLCW